MVITINLLTILKWYLIGVLISILLGIFMQVLWYYRIKTGKTQGDWRVYPEAYMITLYSYVFIIMFICEFLEEHNKNKYWYMRLKHILSCTKKEITLNNYFYKKPYKKRCKKCNEKYAISYFIKGKSERMYGTEWILEEGLTVDNYEEILQFEPDIENTIWDSYAQEIKKRFVRRYK